jgi:hypothetical protein
MNPSLGYLGVDSLFIFHTLHSVHSFIHSFSFIIPHSLLFLVGTRGRIDEEGSHCSLVVVFAGVFQP